MKIYFHLNIESFSNSYIVVNEFKNQAIIIDPCKINEEMINQIENNNLSLEAVFITHNHPDNTRGLKTLLKIYDCPVYAAEAKIGGIQTVAITGNGAIEAGGLKVEYTQLPGHSPDSMVYKIENVLFTGDVLYAGKIGDTNSNYSKMTLKKGIEEKILCQNEDTIIMPGHGPLTSVAAEKSFNMDM